VIDLADGRRLEVQHPELLAYRPGGRMAVLVDGDTFEHVDLLLVTSIIELPPPPARRRSA
jgi:hypothetical protein